MKIFFNDTPLKLVKPGKEVNPENFQVHIDASRVKKFVPSQFIDHVLITNASKEQLIEVVNFIGEHVFHDAKSISLIVNNYDYAKEIIKSKFTVIKAAGGIVRKSNKILLIYRYKKWDFPKGKLEKNEKAKEGAVREVEEECNVKVAIDKKIGNTWHTYALNGRSILKKTTWYSMDCLDDSMMKPQIEEDIEDIRWMKSRELYEALIDSYSSIKHIFEKYQKMEELHFKLD